MDITHMNKSSLESSSKSVIWSFQRIQQKVLGNGEGLGDWSEVGMEMAMWWWQYEGLRVTLSPSFLRWWAETGMKALGRPVLSTWSQRVVMSLSAARGPGTHRASSRWERYGARRPAILHSIWILKGESDWCSSPALLSDAPSQDHSPAQVVGWFTAPSCKIWKRVWSGQAFSNDCYNEYGKWNNFFGNTFEYSVLPEGAELGWAYADLTLWHKKLGYVVCYERLPLPLDAKGLLRDRLGNTTSASSDVAVVSGLMYTARFLHQWRKSGDGSAPVVGWWKSEPKESAQTSHFARLQKTPFTL